MSTVLDALKRSLTRATEHNKGEQVAPAVVLWTDRECQWEQIIPALRESLPQLLTLGKYDVAHLTGPAIWLRTMIARALPEANWSSDKVAIIYLPKVGRQELRAVEECPKELQPLAELQYRGVYWTQTNAKDWTVLAFLQSKDGGLGLDVARDSETHQAMMRALPILFSVPVLELKGKHLDATYFDSLLQPDPIRDLLSWLNHPSAHRSRLTESEWNAFRNICDKEYGFDPDKDGQFVAAQKLGSLKGNWVRLWKRFAEAPRIYPDLPEVLRKAKPDTANDLFDSHETWPQDNEVEEAELQLALHSLKSLTPEAASARIAQLENKHGKRRDWVWAKLDEAPLANALRHLNQLAAVVAEPVGGDLQTVVDRYVKQGWRADAAVLDALAAIKASNHKNTEAVNVAIDVLYRPWLEESANHFQSLFEKEKPQPKAKIVGDKGCCILFADGLRFDVGQKLKAAMQKVGLIIDESWEWVPVPSVTPTAKPRVSPLADLLVGTESDDEFRPRISESGKPLTIDVFRKALADRDYQVLDETDIGDPSGKAWTEYGHLDTHGHQEQWKLAWRIEEEVQLICGRLKTLFEAGWKEIKIVTDHGWLLVPGGLPKMTVPAYLAQTRWGRCAMLKEKSMVDLRQLPWYWNTDMHVTLAPGIHVFKGGLEYAHGGISLQECVIPKFVVRAPVGMGVQAKIAGVKWRGLRCDVSVEPSISGLTIDIRMKPADAGSTIVVEPKSVIDGKASLLVNEPDLEGHGATVVLLDSEGAVIHKALTTVGE